MTAFTTHLSFSFRAGLRNRQLLFLNYLFPLGFYGFVSGIMAAINPGFLETLVPAMVIFAVVAATMLGLPDPLVTERESGVFRSYKINGVPALNLLVIPALTTILHLTVVAAIMVLTAGPLFGAAMPVHWVWFLVVFLAAACANAGLGVLIGVISSSSRVTGLWSQLIFLPSMLIGGLMLPYSMLPESAQTFAKLLPAAHAMNAFRTLSMGYDPHFSPEGSIAILIAGGVVAFGLAVYLFNWDRRNQARRGHPLMALLAAVPYIIGMVVL
jgi:ABC-2 type transport system permease protein